MPDTPATATIPTLIRSSIGGVMMGLANLVPGISGGTMLLAAGVYPKFIEAIGEVTTFKFRKQSLLVLGGVVLSAIVAILLFAGPVKNLVVDHRWVMYSLFIGLTLGGVPVVWRLIDKRDPPPSPHTPMTPVWIGAAGGFIGMAALAVMQSQGGAGADNDGFVFMLLAGAAGAAAMILPGVSGGYLLLVLGVYVPILAGISGFKDALKAGDSAQIIAIGTAVVLPVGIGVLVGVIGVSNLLRYLLKNFERPTLGTLLGLLLGAVVGLWPFQQGVAPTPGDTLKNQTVAIGEFENDNSELETGLILQPSGKPVEPDDYPTQFFTPTPTQIGGALGLILLGFAVTISIDRFGAEKPTPDQDPTKPAS